MSRLEKIKIKNFKSIREQTLELGSLNVFIGGNGSGKSNFIEVFHLLREIVNRRLAEYTQRRGGADTLLRFGRKNSSEMRFFLQFSSTGDYNNAYEITLSGTDDDSLFIVNEVAYYHEISRYPKPFDMPITRSSRESRILDMAEIRETGHICIRQALDYLKNYVVFHFHDTSETAAVKKAADVEDNRFLRPQGENLAAFLYWLQQKHPDHYRNIRDTIRQIAPFFEDFQLAPSRQNESKIRLEWKHRKSDAYFNASSLSDGTLRFMCLATLLLQPEPPPLLLLDEPELGLHPAAIQLLAAMLSSAATKTQIIVATQSVTLINHFSPQEIWTVDYTDGESVFSHLREADLQEWLGDYAIGELWEKNVLGARP